ncbi:MAG: hypothetical protein JW861_05085 [Bacteroidales bacterium]|nr:hypothetical protein [Bacteroidales bacterium]
MHKRLLLWVTAILWMPLNAQHLAAFNDYMNHFWVFDAATFRKLEYLEIQSFQVGGTLIAYIDNGSNLKVYQDGNVKTLITGNPVKYTTTDFLLGYSIYEHLYVYDGDEPRLLSTQAGTWFVEDSLIAWHNTISATIEVYYNGKLFLLEDGLVSWPVDDYQTGDNLIAWVTTFDRKFKLFFHGKTRILDEFVEEMNFAAGRDIMAYMDVPDQSFRVFYKGKEFELEGFEPESFQVGDECMAWVDNLGRFKCFDKGEVMEISSFRPEFYTVTDQSMVFSEQGQFKTICNGQVCIIERYIPHPYQLSYNTIAYIDQNMNVKAFTECRSLHISYESVREINLLRDLIIFVEGINRTRIWYKDKIYTH